LVVALYDELALPASRLTISPNTSKIRAGLGQGAEMPNEVIGPFGQDDLFRFSLGLLALLLAIGVLSILAALLTRVLFDLRIRALANRRGFARWSDRLPEAARSLLSQLLFQGPDPSYPRLPGHYAALHPQRLAAQVANRLHAAAEAELDLMLYFLRDVDGLRPRDERPNPGEQPSDPGHEPPTAWSARDPFEEKLASDTAKRRATAARIDSVADGLQMRLSRETEIFGYLTALLSSLLVSTLAFGALEIPARPSYILYGLLAALFSGLVAALMHNRFDRPRMN
jgi:hypothetical protein